MSTWIETPKSPGAIFLGLLLAFHAGSWALTGRVVNDDDTPVPAAVVYALNESHRLAVRNNHVMVAEDVPRAITDGDGHFELHLSDPSSSSTLLVRDLEDRWGILENTRESDNVRIPIRPPAKARLSLLEGSEKVSGKKITAILAVDNPFLAYSLEAPTGKDGTAEFDSLIPGRYLFRTIEEVPQVGCCFRSVVTRQSPAEFSPGETKEVTLGGTDLPCLRGKIADQEGDPLHGVWIRLVPAGGDSAPLSCGIPSDQPVHSDVSEADGSYAIYDVEPGDYTVICFRRLALNNYSRTLESKDFVTVPAPETDSASREEPTCVVRDVRIDLEPFMPLDYGEQAPPFAGTLRNGIPFSLDNCRGKVVVVHFYAGWCKPCVDTIGDFDLLAQKYPSEDLVVVGVSLDLSEKDFVEFATLRGIDHPVIYDGPWSESRIRKSYRVADIPTTFVIGRDRKIVQIDLHGDVLDQFVGKLLQ